VAPNVAHAPTGAKLYLPLELSARKDGLLLRFSEPLDPAIAEEVKNYSIEQWNYRYATSGEVAQNRATPPAAVGGAGRFGRPVQRSFIPPAYILDASDHLRFCAKSHSNSSRSS